MDSGIYLIECNGVKYVGQTVKLKKRLYEHKRTLMNNEHPNCYMQNLYNKYGADTFSFSVIEYCLPEELNDKEIYWIEQLNTLSPNGMNLKTGGDNDYKLSEETKKKIGIANKGKNNGMWGKTFSLSEETKSKISKANSGKNNGMWGKFGKLNPSWGKPKTKEQIEKNRNSHIGTSPTNKKNSKYYGVTRTIVKGKSYWHARSYIYGKCVHIGSYKTEIEAAIAYNNYVIANGLPNPLNNL